MPKTNKTLIAITSVILIIIIAASSLYFLNLKLTSSSTSNKTYHRITLRSGEKSRELKVEFADTDDERMKGLMNRQELNAIDGMLFIFEDERIQSFWMKNTYIPLDIIFFKESNAFANIQRNAQPCINQGDNCPTYPSNGEIRYVLETKAGFLSDELINQNTILEIKE